MGLLKAFNPHELSADVVLNVVTGREQPLEQILSVIRGNLSAPILQHIIVSAPRGYGKSFFLRYLEVKIEEIARTEGLPLAMALLSEELPHVREPDLLIAEIKRTFLDEPPDHIGVRWVEDDGSAWDEAIVHLDQAIEKQFGAASGLLVAGVENFDLLIRKAFAKPLYSGRLREFLTRPGSRVMLVAASARGSFDRSYDLPLFKCFEEIVLAPWTVDQTIEFLIAQRRAAGKPELTVAQLARATAVSTFISGTPRLATLIGEALLENDPLGAAELLDKIVDELTPYYKERIEILPPRSQMLLDALLRGGERCSATELARRVGAPSQPAIAAPLDDLKKDLVVVGEKAPDSAEVLLRVADRVFAHYYRKRILAHGRESCPLEALVEILALIYSTEEKRSEAEKFAARGLAREAAVMTQLWQADRGLRLMAVTDRSVDLPSSTFDATMSEWQRVRDQKGSAESLFLLDQAIQLAREGGDVHQESSALCCKASALLELGLSEQSTELSHMAATKAEEAINRAVREGRLDREVSGLVDLTWSLGILGRHEEAIVAGKTAIGKATLTGDHDDYTRAFRFTWISLMELDRYEEAVFLARNAAVQADQAGDIPLNVSLLIGAASLLEKLDRNDEALSLANDAAKKAATIGQMYLRASALLQASSSLDNLGRNEEATGVARDVVSISQDIGDVGLEARALMDLAWNLGQMDRESEASVAARECAAKASKSGFVALEAAALRYLAWLLYALGQYDGAIASARTSAERAKDIGDTKEQTLALLYLAWSLGELDRYEDAISAARESLESAATAKDVGGEMDALIEMATNFERLGRVEEATKIWRDAASKVLLTTDTKLRTDFACGVLMNRAAEAELMLEAYVWLIQDADAIQEKLPSLYFDDIAYMATSQRWWPSLVASLASMPEIANQITEKGNVLGEPGRFLAEAIAENRFDDVSSCASHFVSALALAMENTPVAALKRFWAAVLAASAEEIASQISDVRALRTLSQIYRAHPIVPSKSGVLIEVAAEYHDSGRDSRSLARLDPDLATLLTSIFPPSRRPDGLTRKGRSKRNSQAPADPESD